MADIVIESGGAKATLFVPGSPGRERMPAPRPEKAPLPPGVHALDDLSRIVEDSVSISLQARLLSDAGAFSLEPPPEIRGRALQSSLRAYEEALRLSACALSPAGPDAPGVDTVSVSAEARRFPRS